ncbi:MAG: hypothetical protein J6P44_06410 [Bacteroidales bacterium]|nr:hypothetical protein [Bacteroidales bacterium]
MATMTLERRQNDLIRSILNIKSQDLLKKVSSYIKHEEKKSMATEETDDTCMTKEEFFAMIDKSMEEYEKGHYHTMLPNESLDDFLARVTQ